MRFKICNRTFKIKPTTTFLSKRIHPLYLLEVVAIPDRLDHYTATVYHLYKGTQTHCFQFILNPLNVETIAMDIELCLQHEIEKSKTGQPQGVYK